MSKLVKAMERAKWTRGELQAEQDNAFSATDRHPFPEAIIYTKTTVLPAPSEIMARNRLLGPWLKPAMADTYRMIRIQVAKRLSAKGGGTLMVTSVNPGEGKTLTALNLALSWAQEANQTVLLVDANLRAPRLAECLGLAKKPGLYEYLQSRSSDVSNYLINPGIEKFVVLPAGEPQDNSTECIGWPKTKALVRELRSRYPDRQVIFDCPHLLDMPDTLVFAAQVDGILVVVEEARTQRCDLRAALELLADMNVVGIVFNRRKA